MNASRASAWVGIVVLALIVLLAFVVQTGERPGSGIDGSVASTKEDGRRALALLAQRVGVAAEGWRQVPAALPVGTHAVWMSRAEPVERPAPAPDGKRRAHVDARPDVGMHAPELYGDFVRQGGTLLVEGERGLAYVRDTLGIAAAQGVEIEVLPGEGARRLRWLTGETLDVEVDLGFEPLDPSSPAREIATVADGDDGFEWAVALELPEGAGRAIVVADGGAFDNGAIGREDHALFGIRVAEEASRRGRLLFDEYALGLWAPEGPIDVATGPALVLVSANLLFLVLAWTWMRAAPRSFARDPEPLESFSPVLRARAQSRWFERSGRLNLLAAPLRAASFDRLAAHAKLRARREAADPFAKLSDADVERLVRALGPAGARAQALLATRRLATRAELEQLARDLHALEADAGVRHVAPADAGAGRRVPAHAPRTSTDAAV
jgi:hypothetical protein